MAAKSGKEKLPKKATGSEPGEKKSISASKSKMEEDDDLDMEDIKPAKKSGAKGKNAAEDDEEDDDVNLEADDWEKVEEGDDWDPDFAEFDLPKSAKKSGGKKMADDDDDFKMDDEFKDMFGGSSRGGSGYDDDDDY